MAQEPEQMSDEELIERGRAATETRHKQGLRRNAAQRALAEKIEAEGEGFDVDAYGQEWMDQKGDQDNRGGGDTSDAKKSDD